MDNWEKYSFNTLINLVDIGDYVSFRNNVEFLSQNEENYVYFNLQRGDFYASGNIQSLLNNSFECQDYCFYRLFYNCNNLKELPAILSATKLASHCYESMFEGCTSLENSTELLCEKM